MRVWGGGGGGGNHRMSLSVNASPVYCFICFTFNHYFSHITEVVIYHNGVICPLLVTIANSLDPDLASGMDPNYLKKLILK